MKPPDRERGTDVDSIEPAPTDPRSAVGSVVTGLGLDAAAAASAALCRFAAVAEAKAGTTRASPAHFLIGAMAAGIYVGAGIVLAFVVGAFVEPPFRAIAMGAAFGAALTLVIFAGSGPFTGPTMDVTAGWFQHAAAFGDVLRAWLLSWAGNLFGAVILGILFFAGGFGTLLKEGAPMLYGAVAVKLGMSGPDLFALGALCNGFACLAIRAAVGIERERSRCIVIFCCLFAFVAGGFEQSTANVALFTVALLGPRPEVLSFAGVAHNLLWVTLGNAAAGVVFIHLEYRLATRLSGDR